MAASKDTTRVPVVYLPVRGTWRLIRSPGHEAYAFDLVAVDASSHRMMEKSRFQHLIGRVHVDDTQSWDQPVFSPTAGRVVRAVNDQPDRERLSLLRDVGRLLFSASNADPTDISPMAGNHIIIEGDGFYTFLAHLQEGTVEVEVGDEVEPGQRLGRIGNSGHSLQPHLHFQLFDQIDDLLSAVAPHFAVDEYERWTGSSWEIVSNDVLSKGDLIRSPR